MKKYIIAVIASIFILSCSVDRKEYVDELTVSAEDMTDLLLHFEKNYADLINNSNPRNRVVFLDCDNFQKTVEDYKCVDENFLNKMSELNITEVRFEQELDNDCSKERKFTKVYFKRRKKTFDPVIYYLYEYCGSKEHFESPTIYYEPIDDFWGVYIDSNFP